jgi:2-keto-3-deoxy-L-rhamnonate aldolase RhmA
VLARAGFDWVAVDLEHSGIGLTAAARCVQAIRFGGSVPLVRLPGHDPVLAKRFLDSGAEGLVIPDVRSAEQVAQMAAAMHYPPRGTRGVGLWRAQGWGADFEGYRATWAGRAVLVVQVESVQAVEAIDELLASPDVDAVMVGPYDLSASLGYPGQLDHPDLAAAITRVRSAAARRGTASGLHVVEPDLDLLGDALAAGDRFVAYGTDFRFLDVAARSGLAAARAPAKADGGA